MILQYVADLLWRVGILLLKYSCLASISSRVSAGLTDNLLQNQPEDYDEEIEKIFSEVSDLETFPKIQDPQLEDCAVQLWNWSVTKNVGAVISKNQKAKGELCFLFLTSTLYFCHAQRRTWLDCKNPQMADHFLRLAVKVTIDDLLESLYGLLTSRGDGVADILTSKGDVEKDLLRILSCQAESAIIQGNNQEAVVCMQRCKDMLLRLPKDTAYISLLCYNFGVETYNLRQFEDSAFWLSQSYEIGKMNTKYAPAADANILRLLATVYFEWDCQKFQEKALDAVILANKECLTSSGLYLKIRILLRCDSSDRLNEMLESKVSLEECLSSVKLLMAENREELAFEHLKRVCQRFESSPDLGAALVLHIELLLQRGKELLGKQKIEDIITGHYTGKQLTPQALGNLHTILWDKASKHFEVSAQNHSEALQWYNYSLSFFKAGQMEPNLAKLQRNRASCLLNLNQLEKAKDAIREAERCDPDNIFTHFSVYRIAVQENNVEKGNSEQQEPAVRALESLCENSPDEDHILTALSKTQPHQTGSERSVLPLSSLFTEISCDAPSFQLLQLCLCVHVAAWNSALQCESSPVRMRDFFVLSFQESLLCPPDRALLMGQKTGLLMAAAASLELFRKSGLSSQVGLPLHALEYIQICSEIWKTLKASGSFPTDPTDTLLLLYEFEARAKLNDPKVETLLESVLELENIEIKVLETMAALAMEPPAHLPLLCKKALRASLSLLKKQPQPDLVRCSKCVHSLIKLSLPSGVAEVEAHVLEEVWDYYEEALSIIRASFSVFLLSPRQPDDIPEMETLWLLTRAWNLGVLLFNLAQYDQAEKWCGLAMRFVRHLGGSLQRSYEIQVQDR
uniref:Protein ZIP4 homolog n=1 Tax=Salarias fasciatus TaxID=181472 RepID=A0A672HDR7_SALFA